MATEHEHKLSQHDKDIGEIREHISDFGSQLSSQSTQIKNIDSRISQISSAIQDLANVQHSSQKPQYNLMISSALLVLAIVGGVGSLVTSSYDDKLASISANVTWIYENTKELYANLDTVLQREMRLLDEREAAIIARLEQAHQRHVASGGHETLSHEVVRLEAGLEFVQKQIVAIERKLEGPQ